MGEAGFIGRHRHRRGGARLADTLVAALAHALEAEDTARRPGLLQGLDPRAKLLCLLALIVAATALPALGPLFCLFLVAAVLARASAVPLARMVALWLPVLGFTGLISLPALALVPGPALFGPITLPGLRSAAFLVLRAETAASYALLLVLTTPWAHVLKAFRAFGLPVALVMLLGMTARYAFTLAETAVRMAEGRASRRIGRLDGPARRRLAAGAAGALLLRALDTAEEVHLAMLSRGWRGEPRLLDDFFLSWRDGLAATATILLISGCFFWAVP